MKKNQTGGGSLEARAAGALSFPHVTSFFLLAASLSGIFPHLSTSLSLSVSCSLSLSVSRSSTDVTSWRASVCQCCARRWSCAWAQPAWRPAAGAERRAARGASVAAGSRSTAWSPLWGEMGEIKFLYVNGGRRKNQLIGHLSSFGCGSLSMRAVYFLECIKIIISKASTNDYYLPLPNLSNILSAFW